MPNNDHQILSKLVSLLGAHNVLTKPEHLYVYSRYGEFGIKARAAPIAVIRIESNIHESRMTELLEGSDISLLRNNQLREKDEASLAPYLLLDVQTTITINDLKNRLHDLEERQNHLKKNLKEALSFPHWMVIMLQGENGFQLCENHEDIGFCIVQSYFKNVQTYSSKGRLLLAKGFLNGDLEESSLLTESIYNCTACGQCYDQISLNSLEINNAIIKARNKMVQKNNGPTKFKVTLENILSQGNPAGLPAEDRVLWIEKQVNEYPFQENSILFWPGCTTSYRLPELVEYTCHILEEAKYDFGLLGEREGCCGLILYLSGYWEEAKNNGKEILENLTGIECLVTNCSGCYYCFSKIYPLLGLIVPFEVLHTSQIIKESIDDERLRLKKIFGSYMWHDPCDLGRHCNVYEPPRYVLKSIPGLRLLEPNLNKEHTVCCGAGGGLWIYNEDLTNHVSQMKLSETVPRNLDGIITGCPTCLLSLRNTVKEKRLDIKVMDIVEIVKKSVSSSSNTNDQY